LVIVVGWRIVPNVDSIGFEVRRLYPMRWKESGRKLAISGVLFVNRLSPSSPSDVWLVRL
jgi:hypothetical protein